MNDNKHYWKVVKVDKEKGIVFVEPVDFEDVWKEFRKKENERYRPNLEERLVGSKIILDFEALLRSEVKILEEGE